jgi:hypothetical protein
LGLTEARITELQETLHALLGPELNQVIDMMRPGNAASPFLEIPSADKVDLPPSVLADLVARTSNAYVRAARLNGIARAEYKLAEGNYKKKLKQSVGTGRNREEREANAMAAASAEYGAYMTLEAIVELSQAAENAARIASESARKLLDKASAMYMGSAREEHGNLGQGTYGGRAGSSY